MNINDAIVSVVGKAINEGLAGHFGKTEKESVQDAERRWLIANGAPISSTADMWMKLLRGGGYVGSLPEMFIDFWMAGGIFGPVAAPNVTGTFDIPDLVVGQTFAVPLSGLNTGGLEDSWLVNNAPAGSNWTVNEFFELTGVADTSGTFTNISVTATNATGSSTSNLDSVVVSGMPAPIASGTFDPPDGNIGSPYVYATAFIFTGDIVIDYAEIGSYPSGLSLDTVTGVITGDPALIATTSGLGVRGSNAGGAFADTNLADIVIGAAVTGPVAVNDSFNITDGTPLALSLLTNDTIGA